jgi:hypothetical protein
MNSSDATDASNTTPITATQAAPESPASNKKHYKKHYKNNATTHHYQTSFENFKRSPAGTLLILFALSQIFGLETLCIAAILIAIYVNCQ